MGELMLRRGRITLRQLASAGEGPGRPGKRLGTVLVEQGALSPKDLVRSVVEHTQEIIYGAFQWTEGQYRLQKAADTKEAIKLNISTPDLIMEGIRRIDSWSRIDRAVGGPIRPLPARARTTRRWLRGMSAPPEKMALLRSSIAASTVEQTCAGAELARLRGLPALWAFRVIGLGARVPTAVSAAG